MRKNATRKTIRAFLLWAGLLTSNGSSMEMQPHQYSLSSFIGEQHTQNMPFDHEIIFPQGRAISIPVDVSKVIFSYLSYKEDERSQSTFWATCKAWKAIGDDSFKITYHKKNINLRIFPWQECPNLSPRMLYHLNQDYLFLLGMNRNLRLDTCTKSPADRTRFEITCEHIKNTPFLPKRSLIISFAELLQLTLHKDHPTEFARSIYLCHKTLQQKINKIELEINLKLINFMTQKNIKFQNELALYNYVRFVKQEYPVKLPVLDLLFDKITCNLFDIVKYHQRIRTLRKIENKTDVIWDEIMDLDPAPTSHDYNAAGQQYFYKQEYRIALIFFNSALEAEQRGLTYKSNLLFLRNTARTYFEIEEFQNAAYYYDQCFLQKESTRQYEQDDTLRLERAAKSHEKLGNWEKGAYYRDLIKDIEDANALAEEEKNAKIQQIKAADEKKKLQDEIERVKALEEKSGMKKTNKKGKKDEKKKLKKF